MGRPGVAAPLLEGLTRQIDEFHLDRWEDPALCARVVAALYKCVRGKDEARARAIYDRLCQLDIGQAIEVPSEMSGPLNNYPRRSQPGSSRYSHHLQVKDITLPSLLRPIS